MDGVIWRAARACFVLFSSFVRVYFKGEREGGAVFVRSPSSIEYRYSLSRSPSSVFLLSFSFSKKKLCRLFFLSVASPRMPSFSNYFSPFASPRLSIYPLLPAKRPYPLVVPNPYRIVPYRTILQYVSSSSPSNRLTNQTFSKLDDAQYVFERSGSDGGDKKVRGRRQGHRSILSMAKLCSEACIGQVFWNEKYLQ